MKIGFLIVRLIPLPMAKMNSPLDDNMLPKPHPEASAKPSKNY
jgi:hypothetical protein